MDIKSIANEVVKREEMKSQEFEGSREGGTVAQPIRPMVEEKIQMRVRRKNMNASQQNAPCRVQDEICNPSSSTNLFICVSNNKRHPVRITNVKVEA